MIARVRLLVQKIAKPQTRPARMENSMPFQPFGYRFEIRSQMPLTSAKQAIRSRKKKWLDPNNGARGWIAGPFICLWFSALDRYGPMLVGRIASNGFGTRISGRAGSDLNGIAISSLLLPVMALILYWMVVSGEASTKQIVIIGGVLLLSPLVFWFGHKDRRASEPLVRFLDDAITVSGQSLRSKWAGVTLAGPLSMTMSGDAFNRPVTPDAIHEALLGAGTDDFVILQFGPEDYFQALARDGRFTIEKREGDRLRHFQATRSNGAPRDFSFEESLAAFMAYATKSDMPTVIRWQPMNVD